MLSQAVASEIQASIAKLLAYELSLKPALHMDSLCAQQHQA